MARLFLKEERLDKVGKKKPDFWNSMSRKELIKLLSCKQVLLFKKKKNDSKDRATDTKAEAREAGPKQGSTVPSWIQRAEDQVTENYSQVLRIILLTLWVLNLIRTSDPFIPSIFFLLEKQCPCYACPTIVFWK